MPLTFELDAFGWHATVFVSWGTLTVLLLLVAVLVIGMKLLLTNGG